MVRYRVTYTTKAEFGYKMEQTDIVESEEAISRKEIARRLNVDIDSIAYIEILQYIVNLLYL